MTSNNYAPYLCIWESEVQFISALAVMSGFIETGGECYGHLSHAGRPVVLFVTPPGPKAIHEKAHFRQDLAFLDRTNRFLTESYGLNFLGTHHSHHSLGIEGLSAGDIQSTQAIARRNGYQRMCQIVATFSKDSHYSYSSRYSQNRFNKPWYARKIASRESIRPVTLHTYIFEDAQNDNPISCQVKVLNGVSPFRKMIASDANLPYLRNFIQYPTDMIQLNDLNRSNHSYQTEALLPVFITDGINSLPEKVAKDIQLNFVENG